MKLIKLTQGQVALVDDADFEWLDQWKWCAYKNRYGKFCAARQASAPKRRTIYLSRLICGAVVGEQIDHKNGDSLDNRRCNLRFCTASQNQWNRSAQKDNTSGFKGVTWHKQHSLWMARINVYSRQIHLGLFSTAVEAGRAYKIAARKYHGEFSRT